MPECGSYCQGLIPVCLGAIPEAGDSSLMPGPAHRCRLGSCCLIAWACLAGAPFWVVSVRSSDHAHAALGKQYGAAHSMWGLMMPVRHGWRPWVWQAAMGRHSLYSRHAQGRHCSL